MTILKKVKQLKFDNDATTEALEIMSANYEELEFGKKFVVMIRGTILGHDHFLPSDGLINKMKEANVDVGDKIKIKKVAPDEKYPYGYFEVDVVAKAPLKTQNIEEPVKETKKADDNLSLHELSLRVEKVEKITAALWTDYSNRTAESGHKEGDENLPF